MYVAISRDSSLESSSRLARFARSPSTSRKRVPNCAYSSLQASIAASPVFRFRRKVATLQPTRLRSSSSQLSNLFVQSTFFTDNPNRSSRRKERITLNLGHLEVRPASISGFSSKIRLMCMKLDLWLLDRVAYSSSATRIHSSLFRLIICVVLFVVTS